MKDVLDGRADLIGAHQDDLIDILTRQPKSLLAHAAYGDAVGEHADAVQGDALAAAQRFVHTGRVFRLYADDLDARVQRLGIGRDAGDQSAATDGNKNGVDFIAVELPQDFHGNRALTGDDVGVVEGMHKNQISLTAQLGGMLVGVIVVIPVQYDFAAQIRNGLELDFGRSQGHDDDRRDSPSAGGQRNALCMVAGGSANHPALRADCRQLRNFVVSAANFERKHRLQVFSFEPDAIVETARQPGCGFQRGLDGDVVDFGLENSIDVAFLYERHSWVH